MRGWKRALVALVVAAAVLPHAVDAVNAALHPARDHAEGCRILSVIDGDTVILSCMGRGAERARLTGFDTPELFSPRCTSELIAAQRAKWGLRKMIFDAGDIGITTDGRDRYHRLLATVTLDGVALARLMRESGLARAYEGGRRAGWCD